MVVVAEMGDGRGGAALAELAERVADPATVPEVRTMTGASGWREACEDEVAGLIPAGGWVVTVAGDRPAAAHERRCKAAAPLADMGAEDEEDVARAARCFSCRLPASASRESAVLRGALETADDDAAPGTVAVVAVEEVVGAFDDDDAAAAPPWALAGALPPCST